MDIQPLEPRIAFNQTYREEVPISEPTAAALVKGWEKGLAKILTEFEQGLGAVKGLERYEL